MLADQPFVAFIATKDEAKSRHYYEEVLGLRLVRDEPAAIVFDARGTTVRIQKLDAFDLQTFTVLGWQVPDIDAAIEELAKRNVRFERYPGMDQDERRVCARRPAPALRGSRIPTATRFRSRSPTFPLTPGRLPAARGEGIRSPAFPRKRPP